MSSASPFSNGSQRRNPSLSSGPKRNAVKRNSSILNFFKKSDTPVGVPKSDQHRITDFVVKNTGGREQRNQGAKSTKDNNGSLFFEDNHIVEKNNIDNGPEGQLRMRSESPESPWHFSELENSGTDRNDERYNEIVNSAQKRRKIDYARGDRRSGSPKSVFPVTELTPDTSSNSQPAKRSSSVSGRRRVGPFMDESDSEDEEGVDSRNGEPSAASGLGIFDSGANKGGNRVELTPGSPSGVFQGATDKATDTFFPDNEDEPYRRLGDQHEVAEVVSSGEDAMELMNVVDDSIPGNIGELDAEHVHTPFEEDEEAAVCPVCHTSMTHMNDTVGISNAVLKDMNINSSNRKLVYM